MISLCFVFNVKMLITVNIKYTLCQLSDSTVTWECHLNRILIFVISWKSIKKSFDVSSSRCLVCICSIALAELMNY